MIRVRLFGPIARQLGADTVGVSVAGDATTVASLRRELASAAPKLVPLLASCRLAVNHEFADEDRVVAERDEVALIGMVSGG